MFFVFVNLHFVFQLDLAAAHDQWKKDISQGVCVQLSSSLRNFERMKAFYLLLVV